MNRFTKRLVFACLLFPLSQILALWTGSENASWDEGYSVHVDTAIDESLTMASCEASYGYNGTYAIWVDYSVNMMHNTNGDEGWSGSVYGYYALASTYGAKYSGAYSSLTCMTGDMYGYAYADATQGI